MVANKMETYKDLFTRIAEAIETNHDAVVCYFRTFHTALVDKRYESENDDFKTELERFRQKLKGKDETLFKIAKGAGYEESGVKIIRFNELLYHEDESDKSNKIAQRVELTIAPIKGIYLPDELQVFMMSLVLGIEPEFSQSFEYDHEKQGLRLGKLGICEKIGEIKRVVNEEVEETITDSMFRLLLSDRYPNGQRRKKKHREEKEEYMRVILIKIFPDVSYAIESVIEPHKFKDDLIDYGAIFRSHPEVRQRLDTYLDTQRSRSQ